MRWWRALGSSNSGLHTTAGYSTGVCTRCLNSVVFQLLIRTHRYVSKILDEPRILVKYRQTKVEKQFVVKSSVEEKVTPGGEYCNVVMQKDY